MSFSPQEIQQIISKADRFLTYRSARPLADVLQEVADSDYAKMPLDNYGRGGFLPQFEAEMAELLGKESAVFVPSGTMAQQIALRIWSDQRGLSKVGFHPKCHLQLHEHLAHEALHHLTSVLIGHPDQLLTLEDYEAVSEDLSALLLELPQREIGGQLPTWEELVAICDLARARGTRLHLDGARLWECGPYYERSYAEIAAPFDSVYVSFYKIIRALPGAILAGPADFIAEAQVWIRRHGGNLYHQAENAISAKIGLDRTLPRIPTYVAKAREIAAALQGIEGLTVLPKCPPTNLMHLHFTGDRERMETTSYEIAKETGLLLFRGLEPSSSVDVWKMEVTVAESALTLDPDEIRSAFSRVLASR